MSVRGLALPRAWNSLRAILGMGMVLIATLAIVGCVALVLLTTRLHGLTAIVADSVGSVHEVEEAEISLLRHRRELDMISKQELERDVLNRVETARTYVTGPREQLLVADVDRLLETYFVASRGTSVSPADLALLEQRAFAALEELVDFNVAQSNQALARADEWAELANILGIATSVLVMSLAGAVIVWLRRRAIHPILSLSDAMKRFGRGDREARAREEGPVELREMAACFNEMASALTAQRQAQIAVVGGVAHDLRTPLSAMQLAVEVMDPSHPLPPEHEVRRILNIIDRQIGRLNRMLGDFLDMSTLDAGELALACADHDVRNLVREAVRVFDTSADRIRVSVPDRAVVLRADAVRIEQVITNLVSNAIKYSPAGTLIEVGIVTSGDHAVLAVTDHGIGMSPDEQHHIFEPFRRVGRASQVPGVGLGLFTTQRIVGAHGGRIEVESELGRGSTFRVWLPLARTYRAHDQRAANTASV